MEKKIIYKCPHYNHCWIWKRGFIENNELKIITVEENPDYFCPYPDDENVKTNVLGYATCKIEEGNITYRAGLKK